MDKLKRDGSAAKMTTAERLRPIGASAEEEVYENGDGNRSTETKSGERPVHIVIQPQEQAGTERKDSQESSQCLPPII